MNEYVIYSGENVVAIGTADECAEQLKMTQHSFFSMISRVRRGKCNKYEVEVFKKELENEPQRDRYNFRKKS